MRKKGGARKQLEVHILDMVVQVHGGNIYTKFRGRKGPSHSKSRREKGLGPEARRSLLRSGAFEITMAGQQ